MRRAWPLLQLCTSGRKAGPQSSEQQLCPLVPSPGCSVLSRPAFPGCPCLTHPKPKSISVYTHPCPQVSNPDPSSPSSYRPLNKGSRKDLEEETRSRLSGKFCSWAFKAEKDWERPGQRVAGSGRFMYRGFQHPEIHRAEGARERGCHVQTIGGKDTRPSEKRIHGAGGKAGSAGQTERLK